MLEVEGAKRKSFSQSSAVTGRSSVLVLHCRSPAAALRGSDTVLKSLLK